MNIQLQGRLQLYHLRLEEAIDITIPVRKEGNVSCYHLDSPEFSYYDSPSFSGSLDKGGSVNCEKVSYYAHSAGTHTECALHVLPCPFDMRHVTLPPVQMCLLITVAPEKKENDLVISEEALLPLIDTQSEIIRTLVIRTQPNSEQKLRTDYSETNPPYFEPGLLTVLREQGFKNLITDLPSIDKESDGGALSAHKNWFSDNGTPLSSQTITELVYIPDNVPDGMYAIQIQAPAIATDAVPSRVILYPCD